MFSLESITWSGFICKKIYIHETAQQLSMYAMRGLVFQTNFSLSKQTFSAESKLCTICRWNRNINYSNWSCLMDHYSSKQLVTILLFFNPTCSVVSQYNRAFVLFFPGTTHTNKNSIWHLYCLKGQILNAGGPSVHSMELDFYNIENLVNYCIIWFYY